MKQIKLNTLVFIFLSSLITISFLVLFFTTNPSITKLKKYALDREDKYIHQFINEVFVSDIEKQATYLNESFERVTVFAKLISEDVNNIINNKSYKSNYKVELEYDEKSKIYSYINKDTLIPENDTFWGFGSIWIGNNKEKVNKIPQKIQLQLNNLLTLQSSLEAICINPNNIVGIYIIFKDHAVVYRNNIKEFMNTLEGVENLRSEYLLKEAKDKISHWSTYYTSRLTNAHLMSYCYHPQIINKNHDFRIIIKLSFNRQQKRINKLVSKEQYSSHDIIKLIIDNKGNLIYLSPNGYELFSVPKDKGYFTYKDRFIKSLNYKNSDDKNIVNLFDEIERTGNKKFTIKIQNKEYIISSRNIPINKWKTVVLAKTEDIYKKVVDSKIEYTAILKKMDKHFFFYFIAILLISIIIPMLIIKRLFVKPIESLRSKFSLLGKGKFDIRINRKTSIKEVYDLANDFNTLSGQLETFTEKLKKEEGIRQAIKAEMNVAWELQASVLPKITEQFKKDEFELFAKLIPATSMSGDFYDFYYINDDTLAIVLADVSGKGLPAAFYMSMSKAIIKETCLKTQNINPAKILNTVNKNLSKENENCMFLTMYLVFYNIKSGKLTYSNAGHHEYLKVTEKGEVISNGISNKTAIGIFETSEYENEEIYLNDNEIFAIYTDGIIEAPGKDEAEFGTERTISLFEENYDKNIDDLGNLLIDEVLSFQNGKKFDDITLVMIKRKH